METVENLNYLKTDYEDFKNRRTQYNNKAINSMKGLKTTSDESLESQDNNHVYASIIRKLTHNLKGIFNINIRPSECYTQSS
jgi:hypothetical protein